MIFPFVRCTIFLFFPLFLLGQTFKEITLPVSNAQKTFSDPFTGGMKCPQYSETDVNNDGITDIYVFDRVGNIHSVYLGKRKMAGEEKVNYVFSPEYVTHFPPAESWVLLRDYDKDGISDFFAYSDIPGVDGIQVWKGFYNENKMLAFKRINFKAPYNIIFFPLFVGGQSNLYVTRIDIPALDDIDGDGDLDIVTFNINGGFAEFYRNESVEKNFKNDSLLFRLDSQCWGGFYESGSSTRIDFSPAPGICYKITPGELAGNLRHSGSTLLTLDLDGDGDKELFLGDISFPNITLLTNGGNAKTAWMNKQDNYFPMYDFPVDLPSFPASFALDVNQDSLKDLIFAPNAIFNSIDEGAFLYYKNIGTKDKAVFTLVEKNFLTDNTLDIGKGASPTFADINGDGLLDMVVGNYGNFKEPGVYPSGLFYFENNGSYAKPSFILKDSNFLSLNRFNSVSRDFSPVFADMDGDGDEDVLIGDESGQLFYGENMAGKGKPLKIDQFVYPFMDIDVGLYATPFIFDVNTDGLPDLLVGERGGNINYFQNIGSKSRPFFDANADIMPNANRWGGVNTNKPGYLNGSTAPIMFYTSEGLRLLTGSDDKGLLLYEVSEANQKFNLIENGLNSLKNGFQVKPALADLNNDGLYELLVGNARGGLQLYQTSWKKLTTNTKEINNAAEEQIIVYPNPSDDFIHLKYASANSFSKGKISIFDVLGRCLLQWKNYIENSPINISTLPNGFYKIQIEDGLKKYYTPFIR